MRMLYTLLLYLLVPFVLLRLLWRGLKMRDYWHRWNERFGFVTPPPEGVAVWVHAVSVGEALAALPLIRRLVREHGERRVLVTTMTPTGSARVREALKDQVLHTYIPYDLPDAVARFVRRMRPAQVVVMETELWPNLFRALRRADVPIIIANARLSPRSFKGYSRFRNTIADVLADCSQIAAQSALDAERFEALGAPRVSVMGNIKFDLDVPEEQLIQGHEWRVHAAHGRPVWIAASTHEGEEEAVLIAHQTLLQRHPQALLILVPRHPQRFDSAARQIARSGLRHARRSENPTSPDLQVLLGDSMGEMFFYFAMADVAFVGGSLVPVGGHNVLEPAAIGLPVLFGPQMHNFLGARELLLNVQAGMECADAAQLAQRLDQLLGNPSLRDIMGTSGRSAVAANRGALEHLLALLAAPKALKSERARDAAP